MGFDSLRTVQFRNLADQTVSLHAGDGVAREIFLTGENGQGKTNFLEAVYLLAYGSSFRTKFDRRLCRHGTTEFSLLATGTFADGATERMVKLQGGEKTILVDGNAVVDRRDLLRRLPCIAFTHEDYQFVSGAPEFQRLFFDQSLSLFDVLYIDNLRRYRKLLRHRNALLGSGGDQRVLEVYERQMALAGLELMQARRQAVELFNPTFTAQFGEITGLSGDCELKYLPSWKVPEVEAIVGQLAERRESDRKLGFTASGPHRDHYRFVHAGRNFAEHASTGQVRLLSLLLRLVQARLARERTGQKPVLLIDDVLLELDAVKRQQILNRLPEYDQAYFTFLPDEHLQPLEPLGPLYLRVDAGQYIRYGALHG